jgi:hypothetical protein
MVGAITATPEQFMSIGYGMCYHYDSYNYSVHYEHIQVQAVVMQPARWRTMRMQPEQYLMFQYYSDKRNLNYYLGPGIKIDGGLVLSAGLKKKLINNVSTSVGLYQLKRMNHIVIGLNLEL